MNEEERKVVKRVVKEMKTSHSIISYWLKGSVIDRTLSDWIQALEGLLSE